MTNCQRATAFGARLLPLLAGGLFVGACNGTDKPAADEGIGGRGGIGAGGHVAGSQSFSAGRSASNTSSGGWVTSSRPNAGAGGETSGPIDPGGSTAGGAQPNGGSASAGGRAAGGGSLTGGGPSAAAGSGAIAAAGKSVAGSSSAFGGRSTTGTAGSAGNRPNLGGASNVGGQVMNGGASNAGGIPTAGGSNPGGGASAIAGSSSIGSPNVTIDRAKELQTIDGFGFFGAADVWWGQASELWSDAWGALVINDLGLSIWRSEYYSEEPDQDANWVKQRPVVQGMKKIAEANRVPLKFILTVWSPPSAMKCTVDSVQAGEKPCTAHPDGTKNGGTLDPSKYDAYAAWLAQGIKNYADIGIDLYAVSPQNEPMFVEFYNSCVYDADPAELNSYARMISAVGPAVKKVAPTVKLFGTENMLGLEGQEWFYSASMTDSGWAALDILAYHGYQDGVAPTEGSQLATYWKYVRDNWSKPHDKRNWMTETSGYTDNWSDDNGALALGYAIYSALYYGQVSAWVWWQGSQLGGAPDEYALMGGTEYLGKRYYVSKNFYRYIRPGARMVAVASSDPSLFVVAFTHAAMAAFTLVAINSASTDKQLVLGGNDVPSTYDAYRTSATENCVAVGSVNNGNIVLKANSITTLVNGNVIE
jgi:glucuronoarabinoxylan endo-1,4-beta-xylanase